MILKAFELDQSTIEQFNYFIISTEDQVILQQIIDDIKNTKSPKTSIQEIDDFQAEEKIQTFFIDNLFNDINLIYKPVKTEKTLLNLINLLDKNISNNIFIFSVSKNILKKVSYKNKSILILESEIRHDEVEEYIKYQANKNKVVIQEDEIKKMQALSSNNTLHIHNLIKIKSLADNDKNHQLIDQSIYSGFDILNSIFSKKEKDFNNMINRYFQSNDDLIQFNSLLFWFLKGVYRYSQNSKINQQDIKFFGQTMINCKLMAQKINTEIIEKLIQKIFSIDKMIKGRDIQINPIEEMKKVLMVCNRRINNG